MVSAFHASYQSIVSDSLVGYYREELMGMEGFERDKQMFDYTIKGGQCFRGVLVYAATLELLEKHGVKPSAERVKQIMSVGWALEIVQAAVLVADDIMDESHTRRGKACWHKVDRVHAYNDVFKLEHFAFHVLKRHLKGAELFAISQLFHGIILKTTFGQGLDLECSSVIKELSVKWDASRARTQLSMDTYNRIIKYKTSFYTFNLPFKAALVLANHSTQRTLPPHATASSSSRRPSNHHTEKVAENQEEDADDEDVELDVRDKPKLFEDTMPPQSRVNSETKSRGRAFMEERVNVLIHEREDAANSSLLFRLGMELGEYFQVQDDFLDVYGDPKKTGKIGTDIDQRKLTWLMATAVQKADEKTLQSLVLPRGSEDRVKTVKTIFKNLNLRKEYLSYEKAMCEKIRSLANDSGKSAILPKKTVLLILDKIYASRVKKEAA